jgi:hypothetical protein
MVFVQAGKHHGDTEDTESQGREFKGACEQERFSYHFSCALSVLRALRGATIAVIPTSRGTEEVVGTRFPIL